ncbi:MAG TPA: hypothetical protein VNF99_05960 [Stellaceae bacterium]|nr:hypothetical protein [Stellaceae bacterium]
MSSLDGKCIKDTLIDDSRRLGFLEFSGDGRWLAQHSAHDFTEAFGLADGGATNALTARFLLLLGSRPLLKEVHQRRALIDQPVLFSVLAVRCEFFSLLVHSRFPLTHFFASHIVNAAASIR